MLADPPSLDALAGCLLGGAIGDAFGRPFEGRQGPFFVDDDIDLRCTDDTQLTLATCEAIASNGRPSAESIATSLLAWFRAGKFSGLGASTLEALRALDVGSHWALSGRGGEHAAGNGAAIRVAALAFFLDPSQNAERTLLRDIVRITHRNDEAYAGALAVVLATRPSNESPSLLSIAKALPDTRVRERLSAIANESPRTRLTEIAERFGSSGYSAESVTLAMLAAERITCGTSFTAVIRELIACGGDCDSNAALAGQIAGRRLGWRRLPKDLVERLPERERRRCIKLATELASLQGAGSLQPVQLTEGTQLNTSAEPPWLTSPLQINAESWTGRWADRGWMNTPGPYYTAEPDFAELGPSIAPANIACDDFFCDVVYRQPSSDAELTSVIEAGEADPFGGYASDGCEHWTLDGVRAWWTRRAELLEHIDRLFLPVFWGATVPSFAREVATRWRNFVEFEAEDYLRRFCYLLEERSWPDRSTVLPEL